jgi:hypothetical protein
MDNASQAVATATWVLAVVAGLALIANFLLVLEARGSGRTASREVDELAIQGHTLRQLVDELTQANNEFRRRARAVLRATGCPVHNVERYEGDLSYVGGTDIAEDVCVLVRYGELVAFVELGNVRPTETRHFAAPLGDQAVSKLFPAASSAEGVVKSEQGTAAIALWWKTVDGATCWWSQEYLLRDGNSLGPAKEGTIPSHPSGR